MFTSGLQTEIFEIVYCLIVHLSFWRHASIVIQFVQNLQKNNIFGFSVVFSGKTVQILIFKAEYLENGLADFDDFGLILQDFGRPLR